MISEKTVQEILETAKVEEVIGEFVTLKRRGANLLGNCPFHNEKTPSFNVNPVRNIYKCFGCGKAGNAVQFLMEHESLAFPDALRWLANKYGIEIAENLPSAAFLAEKQAQESLLVVNEFARDFYQKQLFQTDKGKSIGLNYFKERGFREETIQKFGLGFASELKDNFTLAALNASHKIDLLKKLGLTTAYDQDFFRNRVMFTIHGLVGKPIAFAGRIMVKDEKAPKYINSPETEVYTKSKVLYGLFFAKKSIQQQDDCLLVEGYTDVISLHQGGVENVVASSGTSLTTDQIRLVKRYTKNIKILYDGDVAGTKAALRGLDMILEEDMNVKIVQFPKGEDPDSYMRKVGSELFKDFVNINAVDFIFFKINLLRSEIGDDPLKKINLIKEIVTSISKIPDAIKRAVYTKECSTQLQVEERILIAEINKILVTGLEKKQYKRSAAGLAPSDEPPENFAAEGETPPITQKNETVISNSGNEFQERDLLRILITFGSQILDNQQSTTVSEFIFQHIKDVLEDFDNKLYGEMAREYYEMTQQRQSPEMSYFTNHHRKEVMQAAIDLTESPYEYSRNWEAMWHIGLFQKSPELNFVEDTKQAIQSFKYKKICELCDKNKEKLKNLSSNTDALEIEKILRVQMKLQAMRTELGKEKGRVI